MKSFRVRVRLVESNCELVVGCLSEDLSSSMKSFRDFCRPRTKWSRSSTQPTRKLSWIIMDMSYEGPLLYVSLCLCLYISFPLCFCIYLSLYALFVFLSL